VFKKSRFAVFLQYIVSHKMIIFRNVKQLLC